MLTWALAWASVKHRDPGVLVLVVATMIGDILIALFAAVAWLTPIPTTCGGL